MNTIEAIWTIQNSLVEKDNLIKNMEQKNSDLTKVVATILQKLERSLKNPSLLNDAVYDSINLCRANFSYMDYSSGKIKKDNPLEDSEKTLP